MTTHKPGKKIATEKDTTDTSILKTKRYSLGPLYPDITFTFREAQCVAQLIYGLKPEQIAQKLALQQQTVFFFIKKIIRKMHCSTAEEALVKVSQSSLMAQIDFN